MDAELEVDEATVRAVAAALMDSAGELAQLADRVQALVAPERAQFAEVVRGWAQRTAADAARLSLTADRYAAQDGAAASEFRGLEP